MTAITTPIIHASFSSVLATIDPTAAIYDNPNQQGTRVPAWYIVHRDPVKIEREIGRFFIVYGIDIIYMKEYNRPRLFDEYSAIADQLDQALVYLTIYGTFDKVQVYDRYWELQLDALKYSLTLRIRVSQNAIQAAFMQSIDSLDVYLKDRPVIVDPVIITYQNTSKPEFDIELPSSQQVERGSSITLPSLSGDYSQDGLIWSPNSWDIGAFNESYIAAYDTMAELQWGSRVPARYPQGQFMSGEMVVEPYSYAEPSVTNNVEIMSNMKMAMGNTDNSTVFFDMVVDNGASFILSLNEIMQKFIQ